VIPRVKVTAWRVAVRESTGIWFALVRVRLVCASWLRVPQDVSAASSRDLPLEHGLVEGDHDVTLFATGDFRDDRKP